MLRVPVLRLLVVIALLAAGCAGGRQASSSQQLVLGGIPDQDVALLQERFDAVAAYLSEQLGIAVVYRPSVSYAAVVTAFGNGQVHLGWFGGLTGVQARAAAPGARAIAQRPIDAQFRSVFIASTDLDARGLADLADRSFTFGSESSTSGHLMPRHFLSEAGIDADRAFAGRPGYSGSHDKTWKLVETGSFDAGALNEAVWERAVAEGKVDTTKVEVVERTPTYFDYHWVAHPRLDELFGEGTMQKVEEALLEMHERGGPGARKALEQFDTDRFIRTEDANYADIERIARGLGLLAP